MMALAVSCCNCWIDVMSDVQSDIRSVESLPPVTASSSASLNAGFLIFHGSAPVFWQWLPLIWIEYAERRSCQTVMRITQPPGGLARSVG